MHLRGDGSYVFGRRNRVKPYARVFVAPGATLELGDGANIGARAVINVTTRVTIGQRSRMSWDCQITDTDFHQIERADGEIRPVTGAVHIGEHVLIGTRSMIQKGVTIGDGAIVAAGSVVVRDVEPGTIVAGNPARAVGVARDWR